MTVASSSSERIEIEEFGGEMLVAATRLRRFVPEVAQESVREIERQLPEFVRPDEPRYAELLGQTVEWIIGHFMDLMIDNRTPSTELLNFMVEVGVGEAREGRTLEPFQTALRIGAGVAVNKLTDECEKMGIIAAPSGMAQLTQALFSYHDRLTEAVAEGYALHEARAGSERQRRLRHLTELLVAKTPHPQAIQEAADRAGWPLPKTLAAIAVHLRGDTEAAPTGFPPDVLNGLHLDVPCLIVSDPGGPGRRAAVRAALRGLRAAVGPAVAVTEVADSLRWARQALDLAHRSLIPGDSPIFVDDHLSVIMIMQDGALADHAMATRLAPLEKVRLVSRRALGETLFACLECHFNATEVSARLHIHPQTVRYRIRKLEEIFGSDIHDPRLRLDYLVALRVWLARNGSSL